MVRIRRFLQPIKDHIVWRIQGLADFLQNHATLDFNLIFVKDRVKKNVCNDIQGQRNIVFQDTRIIGGDFTTGVSIKVAANVFNGLSNLQRVTSLCAFERHMFKEVRNTILVCCLVACPRPNPDTYRCGCKAWHMFSDDAKSVGQAVLLQAHWRIFPLIWSLRASKLFAMRVTRSSRS